MGVQEKCASVQHLMAAAAAPERGALHCTGVVRGFINWQLIIFVATALRHGAGHCSIFSLILRETGPVMAGLMTVSPQMAVHTQSYSVCMQSYSATARQSTEAVLSTLLLILTLLNPQVGWSITLATPP